MPQATVVSTAVPAGTQRHVFVTPHGRNEELRGSFSEFRGTQYVGVRIWYESRGNILPGKNGINVPTEDLPKLAEATLTLLATSRPDLQGQIVALIRAL